MPEEGSWRQQWVVEENVTNLPINGQKTERSE